MAINSRDFGRPNAYGPAMEPIHHLSIPVRNLAQSLAFYGDVLGCTVGRQHRGGADVWFFGMQVTLHERPDEVLNEQGVRHFGVTLDRGALEEVIRRATATGVTWLAPVTTDRAGTPQEQTKAKLLDPSGNVIELKSYPDPHAALGLAPPTSR
jgi:extradiol dioxygenase family protein